jgi:UDP-N-acetylmuramoyl-tripeptide--D-alanyl-D-alanine ligase
MVRCREVEVIGITGSRGKTTTKDLLAQMLAAAGPTSKTRKNDNGLYGVPATLLAIRPEDRFAVVEVGIFDEPGEMSWMSSMFAPSVAVLTSIGEDHTTFYGSMEAIAAEKRVLLERVGAGGTVVVNADDERALAAAAGLVAAVLTAGRAAGADYRLTEAAADWPRGIRVAVEVPGGTVSGPVGLFGTHLAPAVVTAIAAAAAAGVDPAAALAAVADFEPPDGRLRPEPAPRGATWLLDDFKSRAATQAAAIRALGEIGGRRRIAVIGEVQEGDIDAGWKQAIELLPGRAELVIAVGEGADSASERLRESGIESLSALRFEAAAEALDGALAAGDVVLLHGATRQHLRRVKLRLERGSVGCRVRLCTLHWLCDDCPHLHGTPPEHVVIER